MNNNRFTLARKKHGYKKINCPYCHAPKHYVRWIDLKTKQLLPIEYGCCDNANKCGHDENPYHDGYTANIWAKENGNSFGALSLKQAKRPKAKPKPKTIYFNNQAFEKTLTGYGKNTFLNNLQFNVKYPFTSNDISRVVELYFLGTITGSYLHGAVTFPFIDINRKIRAIQVKQFDKNNHTAKTSFLHSIIKNELERKGEPLTSWLNAYLQNNTFVSCLFGEHLLKQYPSHTVCIVEAPKTAIYGSLYFGLPDCSNSIWLASYNLSSLNYTRCKVLKRRQVVLFPDLSKEGTTFEKWSKRAKEFNQKVEGAIFTVSDLLERLAPKTDRQKGNDLADFLPLYDWKQFRQQTAKITPTPPEVEPVKTVTPKNNKAPETLLFLQPDPLPKVEVFQFDPPIQEQRENWNDDIAKLEAYFKSIELPTQPIRLNKCSTIKNCALYVEGHFDTVKAYNGNSIFLPYLNRLKHLKQVLTKIGGTIK